jgi:hypothetical protein
MLFPAPPSGSPPVSQVRNSLPEIVSEVARARPELSSESDEYRAAVLLLLIRANGLNVDRLARRAGYPREFVARCLRRLVDNGWSVEGEPAGDGAPNAALQERFWWDVDVALGRRLRRMTEDGEPEWAPINRWVKEFEYGGRSADSPVVHNEYRHIPPYNPDPVQPTGQDAAGGDEAPVAEEGLEVVADGADRAAPEVPLPAEAPRQVQWLGGGSTADASVETAAAKLDKSLIRRSADVDWLR